MTDPALTPEVLEELTQKRAAALADPSLNTKKYANYLRMLDQHGPALLAAAQRVQELQALKADRTVDRHPAAAALYRVSLAIEALPASPEQTAASVAATEAATALHLALDDLIYYRDDNDKLLRELEEAQGIPVGASFHEERDRLRARVAELEGDKNGAYEERNRLVALLATLFPSGTKRTAIPGWDETWHGCVFIDLPNGQASWHYHDSHAHLFAGLPAYRGDWDGHTTPEKYQRIADLVAARQAEKETTGR